MPFDFQIPLPNAASLQFTLSAGESVYVVGANGTGKSSLMHRFYSTHRNVARRISAHRQTWFTSNAINLSPEQRRQTESSMKGNDAQPQSRWKDDYSQARPNIAIYDLIDAENVRARLISNAVDSKDIALAVKYSTQESPVKAINELLRLSQIPVELSIHQNDQVQASKNGSPLFSVAELSDGERNALLIATDVLTAPPGSLLVIDEPERHLHRSIISPLLTLLFAKRADCAFVVSTHDVDLPIDHPDARALLLRGCTYQGTNVSTWDAELLAARSEIAEPIRRAILGARRRILFVEGNATRSLDSPLYGILFPAVSVVPKNTCRDVIQAVVGVRESSSHHRVHAVGLIDNDRRTPDEIARLVNQGVHALPSYSVESIYYNPRLQELVAARVAATTGANAADLLSRARTAAFAAALQHKQRLCERTAERTIRSVVEAALPTRADIAAAAPFTVTVDPSQLVAAEISKFEFIAQQDDYQSLVNRYPLRDTPALTEIARQLGFQTRSQYESSVRKLLMDDASALEYARNLLGGVRSALDAT